MEKQFATKIPQHHSHVVEWSEIERMNKYKMALSDELVYGDNSSRCTKSIRDGKLLKEIQAVERWMKEQTKNFVFDNNRSFES